MTLSETQVSCLKACRFEPFYPTGWLYRMVLEELRGLGLLKPDAWHGYQITEAGLKELESREPAK